MGDRGWSFSKIPGWNTLPGEKPEQIFRIFPSWGGLKNLIYSINHLDFFALHNRIYWQLRQP
jgi:hypothetical protein